MRSNSHVAIQGTCRTPHYHVLLDENGFKADALQVFLYYLCWSFQRATKAIAVPAPVRYAHLAGAIAEKSVRGLRPDQIVDALRTLNENWARDPSRMMFL